jgi:hypothetical protein
MYLPASCGGPDAVSLRVEDGCFVDIAGANEAARGGGQSVIDSVAWAPAPNWGWSRTSGRHTL